MKNLKLNIAILGFLILVLSACEKEEVYQDNQVSLQEDVLETSEKMIKLVMDDGSNVSFYKIDEGEMQGVFLLEETDCGDCSALNAISILAEKELSEQEIFWALSKPGTATPSFLSPTSGIEKSIISKPQGWGRQAARELPAEAYKAATIACNNNSFTSSIAYGFIGNPEFIRLDKTPNNYGPFANDCANLGPVGCENGTRYRYAATYTGIKKWKGKICSKAIQNSTNNHYSGYFCDQPALCYTYVGPELYFEYLSNGVWKSMKNTFGGAPAGFEVPANSTKSYTYSWGTSTNTSFRLRVKNAMGKDQFDFMMDK